MLRLSELQLICSKEELEQIPEGKVLINTINAHSYNVAQKDRVFAESLNVNDNDSPNDNLNYKKYLIPDGASIVKACRWLKAKSQPKERIAGWDLYDFEMRRLNDKGEMTNDNAVYDLQGRQLTNRKMKKGPYIINGRVVLVK